MFNTGSLLCLTMCCCVRMQVLRSGDELEYEIEMQPLQTLVPVHKYDQLPSYFIYAGEDGCAVGTLVCMCVCLPACCLAVSRPVVSHEP